jgi:glycosyltransferase involved in cell wall biosynthesis
MKTPKVSVVIPCLYEVDGDYLKLAVESLRATTDWQIVVVTNGSKVQPNLSHIKGIGIHLHTRDQGQNGAVNRGARVVEQGTDYIMVSNADMYYAPGWNKNLRFDDLCFSPNLVEPTNNAGSAKPFLKFDGGFTLDEFEREDVDRGIKEMIKFEMFAEEPKLEEVGFNLPFFLRKDVFDTIGGYDPAYDPWGSNGDTDLQTKIELAGVTPKRLRDVLVYHFSNKSGTFKPENQPFWQHNWDYYTQKFGFNRDETGGDPWYCKNMIDYDKLKYKPGWMGKYDQHNS